MLTSTTILSLSVQAISNASSEQHQDAAWQAVCPLVAHLKVFYEYALELEAALCQLLSCLCSPEINALQHLEQQQVYVSVCWGGGGGGGVCAVLNALQHLEQVSVYVCVGGGGGGGVSVCAVLRSILFSTWSSRCVCVWGGGGGCRVALICSRGRFVCVGRGCARCVHVCILPVCM